MRCGCRSSVDPTVTCNGIPKLGISDPKAVASDLSLGEWMLELLWFSVETGTCTSSHTHSRGQPSLGHLLIQDSHSVHVKYNLFSLVIAAFLDLKIYLHTRPTACKEHTQKVRFPSRWLEEPGGTLPPASQKSVIRPVE